MRFRLIEVSQKYDQEFTSVKELLKAAADLIEQTEARSSPAVLQYDKKYGAWIAISPATEALSCEIQKLKTDYIRLTLRGAENNE